MSLYLPLPGSDGGEYGFEEIEPNGPLQGQFSLVKAWASGQSRDVFVMFCCYAFYRFAIRPGDTKIYMAVYHALLFSDPCDDYCKYCKHNIDLFQQINVISIV